MHSNVGCCAGLSLVSMAHSVPLCYTTGLDICHPDEGSTSRRKFYPVLSDPDEPPGRKFIRFYPTLFNLPVELVYPDEGLSG